MRLKSLLRTILIALSFSAAASSASADIFIESTVNWRLENYTNGMVVVWFTGAPGCNSGRVNLPSTLAQDDINRFFSMVLAAKATQRPMGFTYWGSGDSCVLSSFFFN